MIWLLFLIAVVVVAVLLLTTKDAIVRLGPFWGDRTTRVLKRAELLFWIFFFLGLATMFVVLVARNIR